MTQSELMVLVTWLDQAMTQVKNFLDD